MNQWVVLSGAESHYHQKFLMHFHVSSVMLSFFKTLEIDLTSVKSSSAGSKMFVFDELS